MEAAQSNTVRPRVPPVRGLIPTHNVQGKPFAPDDLKRWIRLSRTVFVTPKIDVLSRGFNPGLMLDLMESARAVDAHLSVMTQGETPPDGLEALKAAWLHDVCVVLEDSPYGLIWLGACRNLEIPVRLEFRAPVNLGIDPNASIAELVEWVQAAGVVAVNISLLSPFAQRRPMSCAADSRRAVEDMCAITRALAQAHVEVNLIGLPFCFVPEDLRTHCLNSQQFFLDHQQYKKRAYDLAATLYPRSPSAAGKVITMLLARYTLHRNPIDLKLLPWLVHRPWFYSRAIAWHKLTRHLRLSRSVPKGQPPPYVVQETDVMELRTGAREILGPVCAACSLRHICDHVTAEVRRVLPGIEPTAIPGEAVVSPMHFCAGQPKYYDGIDAERGAFTEGQLALARKANDITTNLPPDRRITPYEYGSDDTVFQQFEGAVQWLSVTNTEKVSRPLAELAPPFTVSVTFGGGIAEYIGFSFGRQCKVVCPMEAYRHVLTLHVEADGHYVLLRDGLLVRPSEFEGAHYVPLRLGSRLELRLSIWNIDTQILSQFVDIWHEDKEKARDVSPVKYSVIVVCTRYARRLQAVLRSLAHQEGFDLGKLEVIVSYVPGLDATDDLIDSVQATYPALRILRSPFPEQSASAKGFIINESVQMAAGEWIVLLDADTLVAPNMFAQVEEVERDAHFIAADGRKMLTPETTAQILIGEIEPWRQWQELLQGPGQFRLREAHGVPVGFFQCVRAQCMHEVKYEELDHFEGADMRFGLRIIERYGQPTRLSGVPVLHLDHGGSQWYGTLKHR